MTVARDLDGGATNDEVMVAVYLDQAAALTAREAALNGLTVDGQTVDGLGDGRWAKQRGNIVGWVRGRCAVNIRMSAETTDTDQILTYARRLDERLTTIGC